MSQTRFSSVIRMAAVLGMVVALALVLGGLPGSAAAAPSCTSDCYVDGVNGADFNDGTQANPLKTIQAAVNQVSAGGTIHVAAATYVEQVDIDKSLTLDGDGPATTIIQAPPTLPNTSTTNSFIVRIAGSGVTVEVRDFTITGPGPSGCGSINYGILVRDAAHANIHDNKIIDVRDTGLSGCQNGNGIQVGRQFWGTTGTADITNNVISGYQKTGIVVDNVGSQADIQGNTISGDGPIAYIAENGIQISRGATATVTSNTVSGHSYTPTNTSSAGILLYQPGATTVSGNTLTNNEVGIDAYDASGAVSIANNVINATGVGTGSLSFWGIAVYGANVAYTVDVTGNTLSSNGSPGGYAINGTAGYGAVALDLDVTGNIITNWEYGVAFDCPTAGCGAGFSNLHVNNNSILGNTHGVDNAMTGGPIDAENNWWGAVNGPSGAGTGAGDPVSANVDYTPFLTSNPSTAGVNLSSSDTMVCDGGASLSVDFSNIANLYGYQFKVNYDSTLAQASGAFVNSWFNTVGAIVPGGWNGACAGGVCKFAASLQDPAVAVSGSGAVATVNFTAVAPGTFSPTITDIILTDIDGFPIPFAPGSTPLTFTVCGQASVSGVVTLQGRLTPMDAGQVTLIDQGGNFPDIVVPFNATTGVFTFPSIPVMPNGSDYLMRATHILYVGNQKTLTDLDPGETLTGQNTRLLGGDADNSGLNAPFTVGVDMSDIACIAGAFGGGAVGCGTYADGSTDINKDTFTNIQDLSIAGGNYNKHPFQPW
jgi:parallel beta-helix repeat protein